MRGKTVMYPCMHPIKGLSTYRLLVNASDGGAPAPSSEMSAAVWPLHVAPR